MNLYYLEKRRGYFYQSELHTTSIHLGFHIASDFLSRFSGFIFEAPGKSSGIVHWVIMVKQLSDTGMSISMVNVCTPGPHLMLFLGLGKIRIK